jgi:hypothetical protein
MKKTVGSILGSALAFLPMLAFAEENFKEINEFVGKISSFINSTLIPLIFALALLMFLWGVFNYFILGGGDSEKREQGTQMMLYAIGGFVVMISIWGIVNMIADGLGFAEDKDIKNIPDVPTSND